MYTGNHKFGRGRGGRGVGAAMRKVFGALPPQPLCTSSASGRLSLGGSRNLLPSTTVPASEDSTDETSSLVGGDPLSFAALIRLAPDLVDEIKRVEAQGGAAKIKFNSNPKNALGNVIDVGGKEFQFTWSHETGGLCDIYEERKSAQDGNGLLVESGCAWRKLNVQRVLDESAKNHVKKLSEEAERQLKSRKAKFLDPSNATVKSQVRALVVAEAGSWKPKKDFFKRRNFEPLQVGGPTKSVHKSGFLSNGTARGRHSASPLPSPQNQSISLVSPSMRRNIAESQAMKENTAHIQAKTKENAVNAEKDLIPQSSDRIQGAGAHRENQVEEAKDVKNLLITLLKENPKGMSIKTLEKAAADGNFKSACKIESLLKRIANFEPPGVYILKPGVESINQKHLSSDSGSSLEVSDWKQYVPEDKLGPTSASDFPIKSPPGNLEEQVPMNELNSVKKIDPSQHFSALLGDNEIPGNSEGQAANSSGSRSHKDSDKTDSGSQSRSKIPVTTGSGSGSDSENDSSSKSKERSDVEINIFNDDHNDSLDGISGNQDGYVSEDIANKNYCLGDNEAELASGSHAPATSAECPHQKLKIVSPAHDQNQLNGVGDVHNEPEDVGELKHEHPDSLMRSKGTSKRGGSDELQFEENSERFKRCKAGSMAPTSVSGYIGGSSPKSSPHMIIEDQEDNRNSKMPNSLDGNSDSNRLRPNEGAVNWGTDVEGYGESQKKSNVSTQLEESKQELGCCKAKGNKSLKSNFLTDANDRRKDASSNEGCNDERKRSETLDEEISYFKYEKQEAELKGSIKSFSQYKEYVQEYSEKYQIYQSLNRILESFRDEFQKLGNDLDSVKGRDMERYYTILTQLRESYHQSGMRHKRLKKIFIVLHQELEHLKQRIKDFAAENLRD